MRAVASITRNPGPDRQPPDALDPQRHDRTEGLGGCDPGGPGPTTRTRLAVRVARDRDGAGRVAFARLQVRRALQSVRRVVLLNQRCRIGADDARDRANMTTHVEVSATRRVVVLLNCADNRASNAGPLAHLVYRQAGLAARRCERPADVHGSPPRDPVAVFDAAVGLPGIHCNSLYCQYD